MDLTRLGDLHVSTRAETSAYSRTVPRLRRARRRASWGGLRPDGSVRGAGIVRAWHAARSRLGRSCAVGGALRSHARGPVLCPGGGLEAHRRGAPDRAEARRARDVASRADAQCGGAPVLTCARGRSWTLAAPRTCTFPVAAPRVDAGPRLRAGPRRHSARRTPGVPDALVDEPRHRRPGAAAGREGAAARARTARGPARAGHGAPPARPGAPQLLEMLDRLLAIAPDHPELCEWAAWSYMSSDQPERALAPLKRQVARHPDDYRLQSWLWQCLDMMGRAEEAKRQAQATMETLMETVRRHPDDTYARSLAAQLVLSGEQGLLGARRPSVRSQQPPCTTAGSATTPPARLHAPACPNARSRSRRRACARCPRTSDWPRRDPDLASLHDYPEFIAMFGRRRSSGRPRAHA